MRGKNITYADITIERDAYGHYLCYALVCGYLKHMTYAFYTKKQALKDFYRYCNSL